jgi:timeless
LISLFEKEMVLDILSVLGQEMELRENAQYNLLMMELLHHLLKSQDPAAVARSRLPTKEKSSTSSSILAAKLKQEHTQRRALAGVRHGHFGGTWMTQQRDGRRTYVGAAQPQQPNQRLTMAKRKNRKAEPFIGSGKSLLAHSRRAPTEDGPATQRANQSLHNFCQRFVKDCYGPVMKSLKNEFRRDSVRLEDGDKVVFFRIVWFFCQWWRLSRKNRTLGQLIFTMDVFTFNLVLSATDTFFQHKKHTRLAQTVALYSEMMHLLNDMYNSEDSTDNIMAMGLLDRLFYGSEPLDRLSKLLSRWAPGTTTREYLCDLVELCHVSLKVLDANAQNCLKDLDLKQANDKVEKMKAAAADFDVKSYFCRKIVSNQLISIYIHLLGQYKINATIVNHRVIAMFLRISRTEIASPEAHDADTPINPLGTRRATLEPMLYNIHLVMVMEKVLNDSSIRKEKEFDLVTTFCTNLMYKFLTAAQENPMLYVECLFRHVTPHRFCESFVNRFVSEELRMIAERELLLEEQHRYETEHLEGGEEADNHSNEDDDEEEELEFTGDVVKVGKAKCSSMSKVAGLDANEKALENEDSSQPQKDANEDSGSSGAKSVDGDSGEDEEDNPSKRNMGVADGATAHDQPEKRQRTTKAAIEDGSSDEEIDFGANGETPPQSRFVIDDDESDS